MTFVAVLTTAAFAERYTLGDDWFLEADLSLIPVSSPTRVEVVDPTVTFAWMIFPPSEDNGTTTLWVAWGNYSDLDVALGFNAVSTSIFGSLTTHLGATYFNVDSNTLVDVLGTERYGVEGINETTREVKGYYVPVTLEDNNGYHIIAIWATNVTKQQWIEFLDTISIIQTRDSRDVGDFTEIEVEPSPEELKAMMIESVEEVETVAFTVDTDQTIKVINNSETNRTLRTTTFETRSVGDGAFNVTARAMKMTMTTTTISEDAGEIVSEMEMYMKGDTMYTKVDGNWTKMPGMPEEMWDQQNQVKSQVELLNASEIELAEPEKVNGEDAYKVRVVPDTETFTMILNQQMGSMPLYAMNMTEIFEGSEMAWTSWISKDSNLILKNQVAMTLILTADMLDLAVDEVGDIEIVIESNSTVTYSNFNKPVIIKVPEVAKNATTWIEM